jgi:hypothetical protein
MEAMGFNASQLRRLWLISAVHLLVPAGVRPSKALLCRYQQVIEPALM